MNKKGFTLVELLVVIVIIGVLSVIIVPSVININKGVNERLYEQKKENIEAAAVLYGNNNEDIFNGAEQVPVYVYELIDANYVTADLENGKGACNTDSNKGLVVIDNGTEYKYITNNGCVVNPMDKSKTLNSHYVILTKQAAGVTAEYVDPEEGSDPNNTPTGESNTLVSAVCNGFAKGSLKGQAYVNGKSEPVGCKCNDVNNPTGFVSEDGKTTLDTNACIIAGDNVNNYLKYGDSKPNWRVLGVYKITVDGSTFVSAKMITNEPI